MMSRLPLILLVLFVLIPASVGARAPVPSSIPSVVGVGLASAVVRAAGSNTLPAPEVRKQQLRAILSRREFAPARQSLSERIMAWILRGIQRILQWIFGGIGGLEGSGQWLAVVLAIAVVVLFLWFLAGVLARLGGGRFAARPGSEEKASPGPDTPKAALDEAAKLASAGDFRPALRLVYIAALLELDERGLIRFDRTGTNWEYLSAIADHPELQRVLRPVTASFDRKWYGHEQASQSDYRAFLDAYRAVEASEAGR